jgi:hypothetical protein
MTVKTAPSTGKKAGHWLAFALAWLITLGLMIIIYTVARSVVLNEVRYQAMGVAGATAASIDPDDVAAVQSPEDMDSAAFLRIQSLITQISLLNDDVQYIYVMRRVAGPDAKPSDYEYVVDQSELDLNQDGVIDRQEMSEPTGTRYDASALPEMVKGWSSPSADLDISPDPPYPDLLSGYAPIKNAAGYTVGMVGVDIIAQTISQKLATLRIVLVITWVMLAMLLTLVLQLYFNQRVLVAERERLIAEIQEALDSVKTLSGMLPICASCKKIRNDQGYWEQIEKIVSEKSDARFSHSICPDCATKLYPDLH